MINSNTVAAFQPDLAADTVRATRGRMPGVAGLNSGAGNGAVSLVGLAVVVAVLLGLEHLRPKK